MGRKILQVVCGAFFAVAVCVCAQELRAHGQDAATLRPWPHEQAGVSLREGVEVGALANGVRVAWKRCDVPPNTMRIWLHVAAGALMEEPGEEGLAHLVEHMVFRGTERWPDGAVDAWARDNGLLSGPDLNAFTDWRETIYLVDLPADDARLLRDGLSVLRDFAAAPRFEASAFAAEKAVVDAEQRESLGSEGRAWAELDRWAWAGLRVAERDILGSPAGRAELTVEDLARFHARWYRPERMTLVLAGDLPADPLGVAEAAFGDLPLPTEPPPTEPAPGELRGELGTCVIAVPEWSGANLGLRWTRPVRNASPWIGFDHARLQRETIAWTILERRLNRLVAETPEVFQDAWVSVELPLVETPFDALEISLMVRGGEAWSRAVSLVRRELEALARHGVPAHELASARHLLLAELAATAASDAERDVEEEAEWLVAMAGGRSLDWSVDELRPRIEAWVREIDSEAVEGIVAELLERSPGIALYGDFEDPAGEDSAGDEIAGDEIAGDEIAGDEIAGDDVPVRLADAWHAGGDAASADVAPRPWRAPPPFVYRAGEPGAVVARSEPDELGIVEVRFANGVRLVHSPAEGARVAVRVHLLGGRRTLDRERWSLGWVAEDVFVNMGLAAHDSEELSRILEPHDVYLELSVEDEAIVLDGNAARDELLLQCELTAAYLSAAAWSEPVWDAMRADFPELWIDLANDLELAPWARFWPELFAPEGTAWIPTPEQMEGFTLDEFRGWLEPELARAPLVVTVWGGITDEAIEAVARTFGALATRSELDLEARLDLLGPRPGVAREYELSGELDRALVYLTCPAGAGGVASRAWATRLLVPVLQERLDARLRDELGWTYGAQVSAYVSSVFPRFGYVEILVQVDPARAEEARDECLELLAALARDGADEDELAAARDQARAWHAEIGWLDVLSRVAHDPAGIRSWYDEERFYRNVRAARVRRHARQLFQPGRASSAILRPRR